MNNKTCQGCKHRQTTWLDVEGTVKEVQYGCDKGFSKLLRIEDDKLDSFYRLKHNCVWKNVDEPYMNLGYIFILRSSSDLPVLEYNIGLIKDKNPTWIGINVPAVEISKIKNILDPLKVKYTINHNLCGLDDFLKIDQFIPNLGAGWTLVNEVKSFFNYNAHSKLIDIHFHDPKPAMLIKDDLDTVNYKVNNLCFNNVAYSVLRGHLPEVNLETQELTYKTFAQKLEENKEGSIYTWGQIK